MGLHLRLVEQSGDEQVVAEGHRTDVAFADAAGGEMGAGGRDHAVEVAPGLEDRHQGRAHRGQVDADRLRPTERAVAGLSHLGREIRPCRERHGGGELLLVRRRSGQTSAVERMVGQPRERPVYGLRRERHQRLESAIAAASS